MLTVAFNLDTFLLGINRGDSVCDSFMQDSAMVHTANFSLTRVEAVFGRRFSHSGLWPYRSPNLNLCDYCFFGDTGRWGLCKHSTIFVEFIPL